jgi:hypothetical protein
MCNLYSIDIGQQAIREIAKAMRDTTGNMPSLSGVFPEHFAPIVRNALTKPDQAMARGIIGWNTLAPDLAAP